MAETGERGKARRRLIIGGALAAAAALVCLYFVDDYHPEGSKPDFPVVPPSADPANNDPKRDPAAPPERTAILGDLKVGSQVGGWTITALTVSSKPEMLGALAVLLVNGKKSLVIWIMPNARKRMSAQLSTVDYTFHSGGFIEAVEADAAPLLRELVKRVRTFEGSPEPPAISACPPSSASAAPAVSAAPAASAGPAPKR